MKGDSAPGGIVVVDLLQVLEGATYLAFIVGAIVAVYELRSLSRDRKTEMLMRMNEYWCSREFEEFLVKLKALDTKNPREIEERCGKTQLWMFIDYVDGIGMMGQNKLVDKKFILGLGVWASWYELLKPWIDEQGPLTPGSSEIPLVGGFAWLASEQLRLYPEYSGAEGEKKKRG